MMASPVQRQESLGFKRLALCCPRASARGCRTAGSNESSRRLVPFSDMFASIVSDVRIAARSAGRQPGFTAVVVVTLALGIGTTTAMFAIVHAALLKPLPYADPERLVLARRTVGGDLQMWNSAPDYY